MKIREGDCEVPPIVLDEICGMLDISNRDSIINVYEQKLDSLDRVYSKQKDETNRLLLWCYHYLLKSYDIQVD